MKTLNDYIKAVQELQAMGMEILQHSKDYSAKLDELENMDIHLQCCLDILTSEEEYIEEYDEDEIRTNMIIKVKNIINTLSDEEYNIVINIIDNHLDEKSTEEDFNKFLHICDKLQVTGMELLEWYSY